MDESEQGRIDGRTTLSNGLTVRRDHAIPNGLAFSDLMALCWHPVHRSGHLESNAVGTLHMKDELFHHMYFSSSVELLQDAALADLLDRSRHNNKQSGVSGMLLYCEGTFAQYLEGAKSAVQDTIARIARDSRHRGILKLSEGALDHRHFPDWSMGFDGKSMLASELGGFDLRVTDPGTRIPETASDMVRTMMLQVYESSRKRY